jgi:hypothetical protein
VTSLRAFLANLARAAATRLAAPDPLAAERARDFDAHVDAADDVLWLWGAK